MKEIHLELDLTGTEYLKYKDEHIYTKDEFIFDNLMFLLSNISKYRLFKITENICNGTYTEEDIKRENNYIKKTIEPILENFSYVLPIKKDYDKIILITRVPVDMLKEELLDILSYLKSHILFHQNELNSTKRDNLVIKKALEKHYKEDLVIYARLVESLNFENTKSN